MVSKLTFNFFYSKTGSIHKVVISDNDNLLMKDFFIKALKQYNEENSNQSIIEELQYYKIKLAKDNGKPDFDLPAISMELVVKESNWFSFSIALNDDHFEFGPPDVSHLKKEVELLKADEKPTKNQVQIQEEGGLCCCLMACFKSKK